MDLARGFGPARSMLFLTAGAVLIAIVSASQLYFNWTAQGFPADFSELLAAELVEWLSWAVYVPVIIWTERRFGFQARPAGGAMVAHAVGLLAFFAVQNTILTGLSMMVEQIPLTPGFARAYVARMAAKLPPAVLVYGGILGAYWLLRLRVEHHRATAVSERLRADLSESRLLNLKMQIHPHFLFNTLHVIGDLVREGDREAAVETIEELGSLLRRALREAEQQEATLQEELDFLRGYLKIQQLRFGDRLEVDLQIDAEVLGALVPSLLLQPLVENAIRHGLSLDNGAGRVTVRAERQGNRLRMEVADSGCGFPSRSPPEGVGLGTLRRRLEHMYGGDARLSLPPAGSRHTTVEIDVPIRTRI